jgi:NADPH:quinone reductase-like Zn-dependent oxidoreductase
MAERYGAKSLDPTSQDFKSTLKSLTNNRGPDAVLEVVGHPEALYTALELVRVTGVVSSCGVHIAPMKLVGDDLYAKGVKMCFGRCHVRGVFEESLGLLKRVTEATPHLIEEFVQKRIKIGDAEEVSSHCAFLEANSRSRCSTVWYVLYSVLQALQRTKDRQGRFRVLSSVAWVACVAAYRTGKELYRRNNE